MNKKEKYQFYLIDAVRGSQTVNSKTHDDILYSISFISTSFIPLDSAYDR
jgi:hypothetical protein